MTELSTTFICEEVFEAAIRNTPTGESDEATTENFMELVCMWDEELKAQDDSKTDDGQYMVKNIRTFYRRSMRRYAVGVLRGNVEQTVTGLKNMQDCIKKLKEYEVRFLRGEEDE